VYCNTDVELKGTKATTTFMLSRPPPCSNLSFFTATFPGPVYAWNTYMNDLYRLA